MNAALLALLIGAVYFAPYHIAGWAHWSPAAVEYLAYGLEATALWVIAGALLSRYPEAQVACAWGVFEAVQRPIARMMFDLSHKVELPPGVTIGEAAFGRWIGWLGFAVAGAAIAFIAGRRNGG